MTDRGIGIDNVLTVSEEAHAWYVCTTLLEDRQIVIRILSLEVSFDYSLVVGIFTPNDYISDSKMTFCPIQSL